MAAVLPGSQPRRDTVFQRLRALALRAEVANPLTRPPLAAADAWAPGTAYRLGEVVSNGGNLYECFNFSGGTSAASGGPTGTSDNSVDDGTVRWIYAGTSLTSATSPIGPTVIAHFNGLNPPSEYGLVNYYLVNPDWGNGRTVETLIKPIGGSAFVQAGEQWRFSSSTLFPDQNGNIGPGRSGTLGGFELITDAPVFARSGASQNLSGSSLTGCLLGRAPGTVARVTALAARSSAFPEAAGSDTCASSSMEVPGFSVSSSIPHPRSTIRTKPPPSV